MKNLVFQVDIPGKEGNGLLLRNTSLYEHSKIKAKEYADKVNADYFVLTEKIFKNYGPEVQKFHLLHSKFDDYNHILYVDSDLVVYSNMPDLFDLASSIEEEFMATEEFKLERVSLFPDYFNSGFMLFKKHLRVRLRDEWEYYYFRRKYYKVKLGEQHCFNLLINKFCNGYYKLSRDFNSLGNSTGKYNRHFTGTTKNNFDKKWISDMNI